MKNIFINFAIVLVFFISIFYFSQKDSSVTISGVKIAGQEIKVDLAITKVEHSRGLSGRAELQEDEGMLFVFDHPAQHPFWMKEMNFPIDIIWLSKDKKVVDIKKDARPELYPEIYTPSQEAKYVLEVVSGFSEKHNLKVGDKVKFSY